MSKVRSWLGLMSVAVVASVLGAAGAWYFYQQHRDQSSQREDDNVQQNVSSDGGGTSPHDDDIAIEHLKQLVAGTLKDPASAQFAELHLFKSRMYNFTGTYSLCGRVNAKNSYGGYAGYTDFVAFDAVDPASRAFTGASGVVMRPITDRYEDATNLAHYAMMSALYCRDTDLRALGEDFKRNTAGPFGGLENAGKWYDDVYKWGKGKQLPNLGWVLK